MKYEVLYEDSQCNDHTTAYDTAAAAERAIADQMKDVAWEFEAAFGDYDYGNFGPKTEIWVPGNDPYASWTRLWQ